MPLYLSDERGFPAEEGINPKHVKTRRLEARLEAQPRHCINPPCSFSFILVFGQEMSGW